MFSGCEKMAESIDMSFGLRTLVPPRNHVLDGGEHRRHLANTIKPSMCIGDAACCQITLTFCHYYYYLEEKRRTSGQTLDGGDGSILNESELRNFDQLDAVNCLSRRV